jgi:NinB protein
MSRALIVLNGPRDREKAIGWIKSAPAGCRVEFKHTKRTIPQNSLFWSLLSDIATQVPWHGVKLKPDDYKLIFLDALKQEVRIVPNLAGDGFVNLGRSSSDLSKDEMTQLIELIIAWGTQKGVNFKLLPDATLSKQGAEG